MTGVQEMTDHAENDFGILGFKKILLGDTNPDKTRCVTVNSETIRIYRQIWRLMLILGICVYYQW